MQIDSWKYNFLSYIQKIENISNDSVLDIIKKDDILHKCFIDFLNPSNLKNIVVLYGDSLHSFRDELSAYYTICSPYLEGKPSNMIIWEPVIPHLPTENIVQLSYLILDDIIDPLYEFKLLCNIYNIKYNIKNIEIKCLIDNRTPEYKNPQSLSIENRSGLRVTSVITTPF